MVGALSSQGRKPSRPKRKYSELTTGEKTRIEPVRIGLFERRIQPAVFAAGRLPQLFEKQFKEVTARNRELKDLESLASKRKLSAEEKTQRVRAMQAIDQAFIPLSFWAGYLEILELMHERMLGKRPAIEEKSAAEIKSKSAGLARFINATNLLNEMPGVKALLKPDWIEHYLKLYPLAKVREMRLQYFYIIRSKAKIARPLREEARDLAQVQFDE